MSAISTILTRLRAAIWAIDVRDDIANAIEQCYNDVNNPTLKTEALEAALQNKIDQGEMAALTIGDHTITAAKLAQGVIDNTLATSGAAADAKKTGDEIGAIKADLGDLSDLETESKTDLVSAINEAAQSGLSDTAKSALLACFEHVVWDTDDYDALYDNLETALYSSGAATPVYSLSQPLVCDGNTYVSTGVKLYDTERDYTILLDVTVPTNDNSAAYESIVDCMDGENAPYPGLGIAKVKNDSTLFRYRIMQTPRNCAIQNQEYNSGNHRLKLAVRTRLGEGISDIRGTIDGQEAVVTQDTPRAFAVVNKYVGLGGQIKMDGTTMYQDRYFKGTINDFKIYYEYLSNHDVQEFLS